MSDSIETVEGVGRSQDSIVDFSAPSVQRYNKIRKIKDKAATAGIGIGGVSVLAAILMIFLYLLYEVVPMFKSASVELHNEIVLDIDASDILYVATEEQVQVGMLLTSSGDVEFIRLEDGGRIKVETLPANPGATITSFALHSESSRLFAVGYSDGTALIAKHQYMETYPEDGTERVITPRLDYPFGEEPLELSVAGNPLLQLAVQDEEENLFLVAHDGESLFGIDFVKEEDLFGESFELEPEELDLPLLTGKLGRLLLDSSQRWLAVETGDKQVQVVDIASGNVFTINTESTLQDIEFLLGGISLMVSDKSGTVSQWFPVREDGSFVFKQIRQFSISEKTVDSIQLAMEQRRKGFASVDNNGVLKLFNTTAEREAFSEELIEGEVLHLAFSPRADRLLVLMADGRLSVFDVDNEHPEVSMSSMWSEVWYESYEEPEYVWQSSASSNDFEPKLSLMPLSFGTLKAAFYAMLLGAPLAVCGAIYTAYFMTPVMRRKIKPLIELMEALPTVILGFLAGLWLAPFMENNMAGIFTVLLVMPPGILLFAYGMSRLPVSIQNRIGEGWHGFILIPVVLLIVAGSFVFAPGIESLLFGGDMRSWLTHDVGIPFDQRNALVVGIAMGFAVIPTIFSIAEDAIFSVPKHLSYGSLALGATPWQTLVGVVLPTASPGIFSGLMIGMGRAVGETMIVLMATGNTPIMDANIFEGMRTLSANIAVEVPEAEVDSTHYRVLFLTAFVLFVFTFVVNTIAETVRHRLRKKYGSL